MVDGNSVDYKTAKTNIFNALVKNVPSCLIVNPETGQMHWNAPTDYEIFDSVWRQCTNGGCTNENVLIEELTRVVGNREAKRIFDKNVSSGDLVSNGTDHFKVPIWRLKK